MVVDDDNDIAVNQNTTEDNYSKENNDPDLVDEEKDMSDKDNTISNDLKKIQTMEHMRNSPLTGCTSCYLYGLQTRFFLRTPF